MFNKIIQFIKYNNLTVLILLAIFIFGSAVFAQTETGQAVIGEKLTSIQGVDKILLLEADLEKLDMDFKIESIRSDDKYYYIKYTYIDLVKLNGAWQYQIQEKEKKVSKKLKKDLGNYLAKELSEEYELRIKDLKLEQEKAKNEKKEERVEVTKYGGLIGQTLDLAGKIFPGYEPIIKRKIPTPSVPATILQAVEYADEAAAEDNLENIYKEYVQENDPDSDNIFSNLDNCPNNYNSDQLDQNNDGIGDACDKDTQAQELNDQATSTPEQGETDVASSTENSIEGNSDESNSENEDIVNPVLNPSPAEIAEPEKVEIIELSNEPAASEPVPEINFSEGSYNENNNP